MNQQSFWQKYVMGMLALHPRTCASNGYSDIMDVAECKSAAIEVGFVGENANNPHRQSENDRPHGCRRQTFGPALWINDNPNSPTTASDVHSVVCKAGTARFAMSEPGHNCHDACSSIDEECREDMLFPQSADEVVSWALEAGVTCTSIVERCDMGESPIFKDGICTFCNNPNHPGWGLEFFGNRCQAQWRDRERICPCTSTSTDMWTNEPTEFLAEGIEGSVCETDDDCDSSRCNLNELPHRCREKEGHSSDCTKNSDCLSDLCLGQTCVDGRENDRCKSDNDCHSGRCAFDFPFGTCQSRAEYGEKCIRDNDCTSENCLLFTCSDRRNGAHCVNDDDCISGSCVWGARGGVCKEPEA